MGRGCSLEVAKLNSALSPEWRVFCHLPHSEPQGSSRAGPPLYSTQEKIRMLWTGRSARHRHPLPSPQAARAALCHAPSEGSRPQVAPHPSPACRCPRSAPLPYPCPCRTQPSRGRLRVEQKGPRSRARRTRLPPPALGRRPALETLSSCGGWEGVILLKECSGAFWSPSLPATSRGHFSLDFSCNVFPLYLGVGQSLFGSFAVAVGNSSEQLGNNFITHHRKQLSSQPPPPARDGGG